jgi:hypothetical protein
VREKMANLFFRRKKENMRPKYFPIPFLSVAKIVKNLSQRKKRRQNVPISFISVAKM